MSCAAQSDGTDCLPHGEESFPAIPSKNTDLAEKAGWFSDGLTEAQ